MVARNTRDQVRRVQTPAATPLLITDGALVTAEAVWTWVLVPLTSTYLAEETDLDQATLATARSLAVVLPPGVDYHLKVLPVPHTGQSYRRSWTGFDSVRAPGAEDYIGLGAHRIDLSAATGRYRRKLVPLGIRCPGDRSQRHRDHRERDRHPIDRRSVTRETAPPGHRTTRPGQARDRPVAGHGRPVQPAGRAGAGRDDRLVLCAGDPPGRAAGPGSLAGDRADARRVVPR